MSTVALTPHSAPRSVDLLAKEPPFQLRLLAEKLGGLDTQQDKMGWHGFKTNEARATYVLSLLQAWDRLHPAAAAPAPAAAPEPEPAPTVAAVAPAAVAAAAAATSDRPKRTPRTSASAEATVAPMPVAAPATDLGASIVELLNKSVEKQDALLAAVKESNKNDRLAALEAKNNELTAQLQGLQQLQTWTLTAFLTFMQEQMGASMIDILAAAIADSASLQEMVGKATGKDQ